MLNQTCIALMSAVAVTASAEAQPVEYLGPSPYLDFDNDDAGDAQSPFRDLDFDFFFLEDFEIDGVLNTPGVSTVEDVSAFGVSTAFSDSVDGDDGVIDGTSTGDSRALFTGFEYDAFTFVFDEAELGGLPTHVGLVWTDVGRNNGGTPFAADLVDNTVFEVFGPDGESLGEVGPFSLGDSRIDRGTEEDRFLGAIFEDGISRMKITMPGLNNWSVDHVQYGGITQVKEECLADVNRDGLVNGSDFFAWVVAFSQLGDRCDQNGDGACNADDFLAWVDNFNAGCDQPL